jgi:hypothetical protein
MLYWAVRMTKKKGPIVSKAIGPFFNIFNCQLSIVN